MGKQTRTPVGGWPTSTQRSVALAGGAASKMLDRTMTMAAASFFMAAVPPTSGCRELHERGAKFLHSAPLPRLQALLGVAFHPGDETVFRSHQRCHQVS